MKNLSNDDLNDMSSFTLMYPRIPPIDLTYSSICLYHEFGLSIVSTLIALIVVSLNGSKSLFDKISVMSVISNGFLKSGLSVPYFRIDS